MPKLAPKERFLELRDISAKHRDLVVSNGFVNAVETALIQMFLDLPTPVNNEQAAANYYAMYGARVYLAQLLNLGEQPKPLPKTPQYNLDHSLK